MRHRFFAALGGLELLTALVLFTFVWQLPGPAQVQDTVGRMERVSHNAGTQVRRLRDQVRVVRERQPQLQKLSVRLQKQLRMVGDNMRSQQVDYRTVRTVGDALGDVATGLDGLAQTLDPQGIGQVGTGLRTTADYLDKQVAPNAEAAADRVERTTALIKADAERLSALMRGAPLDLRAAKAASAGLGKFDDGLARLVKGLKAQKYDEIREGFKGLETALSGGAAQVDRLAKLTYPVMSVEGLRLEVEHKPLWPEAKTTAEGMRKAAKGVTAASKELAGLHKELPKLRESLEGSQKVVTSTRQALDTALKQQEKLEPLLKNVPAHAALLAEELPQVGGNLAKILRETGRLKELAGLLRQVQHGIDMGAQRWPELRGNLGQSSVLLRATQKQLRTALAQRKEFEAAAKQTLILTETFAGALPFLTEQLEEHLLQQEESLKELSDSLEEVSAAMPACSQTASQLLVTTRLLLALVAGMVALHAAYVLAGTRVGAPHSPEMASAVGARLGKD
jgi:hypothetical protein